MFACESGYHAALNKSSLRATAERLEGIAHEQDPDRFQLRAPASDKVYTAAKARAGSECKFKVRRDAPVDLLVHCGTASPCNFALMPMLRVVGLPHYEPH